jgi:hypothetical protein
VTLRAATRPPLRRRPLEPANYRCHTALVARPFFDLLAWLPVAATALFCGCSEKTPCSCPPDDNRITVDNGCWSGVTVTTTGWCLATWGPPDADASSCQSSAWVSAIGNGACTVQIDMPDGRSYETSLTIRTVTEECCAGQHIWRDSPTVAVDSGTP